jgi:hypothetical protein
VLGIGVEFRSETTLSFSGTFSTGFGLLKHPSGGKVALKCKREFKKVTFLEGWEPSSR